MNKKAISLLLAIFMLLSTIVSPSYAINQDLPQDKVEAGDDVQYSDKGNKKIFKIDKRAIKEVKEPALRSALQSNRLRRAPINATRKETMTVKLTTKGLGNGAQSFDWSLFNNRKFTGELLIYDVDDNEYYPEKDGKRVTIDFTKDGEQTIEFEVPVGLDVDSYNIVVKTIDNFEVRATYTNASTSPSGAELKLEFTVIELTSPFVEVIYKDAQGQNLAADKLPATTDVNITADGVKLAGADLSIPLPTQNTKYNIAQGIPGKGRATTQELNNFTDAIKYKVNGQDSGLITLDNKEFKLSITNSLKDGSQIVLTLSKADQLKELGGLNPKTIKVWKDDVFAWKDGVEPADENNSAAVKELLKDATVTDITTPTRDSSKAGKFPGKLQVKFDDGSSYEVDKQMLIVSEHIVTLNPNDPDAPKEEDLPDDKIEVKFLASTGVNSITTTGKTYVKPGTTFKDTDFPQEKDIKFNDGYKGPVTWTPKDKTVTTTSPAYLKRQGYFRFTATAGKTVIPTNPDVPKTPDGYVLVTFTKGDHGTLKGIGADGQQTEKAEKLAYNVKATATYKDLKAYEPTIVADKEWKVADAKWNPALGEDDAKVTANTHVAQYAEDKTVIPTNPDDPKTPDGYVLVTFTKGDHGTLKGIGADGQQTEKAEKLAYNVKATATYKDLKAYEPTIVADKEWKVADAKWNPALGEDDAKVTANTHVAQYAAKTPTIADKDNYDPHYKNQSGKPGETVQIDKPTFTKKGEQGTVPAPTDGTKKTTFTKNDTTQTNVTVDPNTGAITVVIPSDAKVGDTITIPVDVTYPDGSNETVDVTITVIDKVTPPSYNYLTLTLDENYRGGEITHYDVYQGELIERYLYTPRRRGYVFEGWSYNSRRLDEVRPGDGIYYPTTLYAIWSKQKVKDDEDVEPIDTREVGEHKAYMFGYTDGTVRPNGYITRAEAAALVTRLLGLDTFASAAEPAFTDTPSSWYNKAINAAVQRGIMKGYPDGSFRPNAPITRAEFTQMISTIDNKPYGVAPFADVVGHWAERPIGSEYQAGRIKGYPDGTFRPNAFITRCEAVVILNKIFERNYDAMSAMNAKNKEYIKRFIDLAPSFWGFNDMVEATNTHLFKRRVKGSVQEDWVEVK